MISIRSIPPSGRRCLVAAALVAVLVSCGPAPEPAADHNPLVVLGIDGATWDVMRPLLDAGELPAFQGLMEDGTISGGMIPKLETCVAAVEQGVDAAVVLDGRIAHVMLLEIFTDRGIGTLIRRG